MWLRLLVLLVVAQVLMAHMRHTKHRKSGSHSGGKSMEWKRGEGSSSEESDEGGKSGGSSESSEEGGKRGHHGRGGRSSSESSEEGGRGGHHGHGGHHGKKCKKHGFHHFFKHHHGGHHGGGHGHSGSGSRSFEHHGGRHGSSEESGSRSREWHHGGHHKRCPKWGAWQQSKCLWPSMDYSAIPDACKAHPKDDKIPQTLIDFKSGKAKEIYDVIQTLFKNRGATKPCGYCSRKVQCRNRDEEGHLKHGCQFKQFKMVNEDCDGTDACQLTPVLGGCPAPVPQRHLLAMHMRGHQHSQHGHFHHYAQHWGHHHGGHGHHFGGHSSEEGHWGRGPRSAEVDESSDEHSASSSKSNETSSSSSKEHLKLKHAKGTDEHHSKEHGKASHSGEHEGHGGWGHHGNHTEIPLWNCVKTKDGGKCLCCCGSYFPDLATGTCKKMKLHHKMHRFDLWDLTSGGMPTGGKTE